MRSVNNAALISLFLLLFTMATDSGTAQQAKSDYNNTAYEVMDRSVISSDWPMWRFGPGRGASTLHQLSGNLHVNWVRELPEPDRAWPAQMDDFDKLEFDKSYEPIVSGNRIFVASMVNDRLTAYDTDTGETVWHFDTNGPIRLAPVAWNGRLFVPSDDGYIYSLNAVTGELVWKFRGGPIDRSVLGNERLISMWSVRGGPVIKDGILYFAAGVWPHEGVFIYALNAESGEKVWVNSGTGSRIDLHPHGGAYAFGGVAPQGSFAISGDKLIVPGGRTTPAVFNRHTGELLYFRYQQPTKGGGGFRVYADDRVYFNPAVYINQMYSLDDGSHLARVDAQVVTRGMYYGVEENRPFAMELGGDTIGGAWWANPVDGLEKLHLRAGNRLYGSGHGGMIYGLEVEPDLSTDSELKADIIWESSVEGEVSSMIAANYRLFVITLEGRLYCFGPDKRNPTVHSYHPESLNTVKDKWTGQVKELLESTGNSTGYALMFGIGSGRMLEELLVQSDMHIVAFDPDQKKVDQLREQYHSSGLYGKRLAVHQGDVFSKRFPEYIASLIVSEDPVAGGLNSGQAFAEALYHPLRPYGGTVYLAMQDSRWYRPFATNHQKLFTDAVKSAGLEKAELKRNRDHVMLQRPGPLPGSGVWTHQYSDAANTTYSADDRVRAPMGITWFGGPSNDKTLPRHMNGPVPQVVEGRLVILGLNHINARCVYTGRELWSVELPMVGENFTSLEHEAQPAPVYFPNHPGANFIGSPYVTTPEGVYIIHRDRTLMLDLSTGETLAEFNLPDYNELPDNVSAALMDEINKSYAARIAEEDKKRWGHIIASGEYLVVGAYPHIFDDQQPGRAGNWNATSSEFLLVMNRFNGEIKWVHQARYGFRHNAIAATDDRIFVIDNLSSEVMTNLERRGIVPEVNPVIRALDIENGRLLWSYDEDVFGTWLSYDREHDVLLQAGRRGGRGVPDDEPRERLMVLRGEDGQKLWDRNERHTGPVALHNAQRRIIAGQNERSLDLLTGNIFHISNPISGIPEQWRFNHTYGCGSQNVSKHLITFRSGAAGYHDLLSGSGTGNLAGFRAGCTNNLMAADGVLNAPDYTRSCSCSYQHQTSLAFVHMPDVEQWNYNTYSDPEPGTIRQVGINFGAPGSRLFDGTMWINYPLFSDRLFSRWDEDQRLPVPRIPFEMNFDGSQDELEWFTGHALEIEEENGGYRWVAASGVQGIRNIRLGGLITPGTVADRNITYTVRLHFAEPDEIEIGRRVFDVLLQGEMVLQELDITDVTGGSRRVYVAEISGIKPDANGNMTLDFIQAPGSMHSPMISGVDVKLEEQSQARLIEP